jgi:cysteine synthase A
VLAGEPLDRPGHRIQGGGYAKTELAFLDTALIDGLVQVSDDQAIVGARRLVRQEGIFGGFSGGACLAAAEQLLRDRHAGETIAIVIADPVMKYLGTDLWKADRDG